MKSHSQVEGPSGTAPRPRRHRPPSVVPMAPASATATAAAAVQTNPTQTIQPQKRSLFQTLLGEMIADGEITFVDPR